jgi:phosphatidylglycerophosphate synthase
MGQVIELASRRFGQARHSWRGFNEPVAKFIGARVSANTITVLRTVFAPAIVALVYFDWVWSAFWLFVACGLGDSLDGMVATARQKLGFQDDPKLGAFLDAFCDKIFWMMVSIGVLPMLDYQEVPKLTTVIIVTFGALWLIESALAIVRVSDYAHERQSLNNRRLLKSTHTGQLKFTLEMVGLGGIILAQPHLYHWAFFVGLACSSIAVPFAWRSLLQKLDARKPAP